MTVLVDTSCWTRALRRSGDAAVRERVRGLLDRDQAAWCAIVRLELWNGANNDWDRQLLREMDARVRMLPIDDAVWQRAVEIGQTARGKGVLVPVTDLVIFACAQVHDAELEHVDRHFELLKQVAAD